MRVPDRSSADGVVLAGLSERWHFVSGDVKPIADASGPEVCLGVLSTLDLAALASSAMRSRHEGIMPVLHSNFHKVETQSSRSSKASLNLSVAISWSLPLAKRKVFLVCRSG